MSIPQYLTPTNHGVTHLRDRFAIDKKDELVRCDRKKEKANENFHVVLRKIFENISSDVQYVDKSTLEQFKKDLNGKVIKYNKIHTSIYRYFASLFARIFYNTPQTTTWYMRKINAKIDQAIEQKKSNSSEDGHEKNLNKDSSEKKNSLTSSIDSLPSLDDNVSSESEEIVPLVVVPGLDDLNVKFSRLDEENKYEVSVCKEFNRNVLVNKNYSIVRYSNIYCLDKGGTKDLKILPEKEFYHMNQTEIENETYLFAQAPNQSDERIAKFFEVIWNSKTRAIVKLAKAVENGKNKCPDYWTEENTYGKFKVTPGKVIKQEKVEDEEEIKTGFEVRVLKVTNTETNEVIAINFFDYTDWPDFGAPKDVDSFLNLHFVLKDTQNEEEYRKKKQATLVHCSAGVGRTGTYLFWLLMLEQARKTMKNFDEKLTNAQKAEALDKALDMGKLFGATRNIRAQAIQSNEQLQFLYRLKQWLVYQAQCEGKIPSDI